MKLKITLLCIAFTSLIYAQTTLIPDSNFEQSLIDQGFDTNGLSGNILNSDAAALTELSLAFKNISNLSGIEAFVNLEVLNIRNNLLFNANLSSLTNLKVLDLRLNNFSSINLSNNSAMEFLFLDGNRFASFSANGMPNLLSININDGQVGYELNSINVLNNPLLIALSMDNNMVTFLDLSNNSVLNTIVARNNNLQTVNMANGNNMAISSALFTSNPNLTCIQVDDVNYANTQASWIIDDTTSYCSTLGLNETILKADFKLYPNPVTNTLNIETANTVTALELSDINGKTIYKSNQALQQLDMSAYNSGLYFLKIETEKGVVNKKVVKE